MVYADTMGTPLGTMLASCDGEALTGLWFTGQKYFPVRTAEWVDAPDQPVLRALRVWLADYFAGKKPDITFRLAPRGTNFQTSVWKLLQTIPYGRLSTYGGIAARLAPRGAAALPARAVGTAVGHNPISLLIPCHRVIGADGSLTGYAGGIDKKKALLLLEGAVPRF
jgi:methylated-DNA-[protein]-cysteine S-methyltransferase